MTWIYYNVTCRKTSASRTTPTRVGASADMTSKLLVHWTSHRKDNEDQRIFEGRDLDQAKV